MQPVRRDAGQVFGGRNERRPHVLGEIARPRPALAIGLARSDQVPLGQSVGGLSREELVEAWTEAGDPLDFVRYVVARLPPAMGAKALLESSLSQLTIVRHLRKA
jgi:hypothetical protein